MIECPHGHLSLQCEGPQPLQRSQRRGGSGLPRQEDLTDERTGERHNYSRRSGVDAAEIVAPDQAPDWVRDRTQLWNAAEASERRRDSQVAREVMVALPIELDREEQRDLVREFSREEFASQGMVADVAYHGLEARIPMPIFC